MPAAASGLIERAQADPTGLHLVVRYPAQDAPVLPVGRSGELRVQHEATGHDVIVMGKVSMRQDDGGGRTYYFLLGDRSRQALAPIFEPRRTDRIVVEAQVSAVLRWGDGGPSILGAVRDLSAGGACVEVPWEDEARLAGHDGLEMSLGLEGRDERLELDVVIRSRRLGAGVILLGLSVSDSGEAALEAWVAELKRQGSRSSSGARRSA